MRERDILGPATFPQRKNLGQIRRETNKRCQRYSHVFQGEAFFAILAKKGRRLVATATFPISQFHKLALPEEEPSYTTENLQNFSSFSLFI